MSRTRNTNEAKKGLYYNVNKRKKAGTSRKKGHPDAPSDQDWKNAAKTAKKSTNEGLADMAHMVERDHEVQMARADLYKIAKYAIKLHDMLKGISEAEGIQGWQQAKITKASDYISAVYHNLDYDMKFNGAGELGESADHCAHCGCKVGNPKPGCDCKEDCHSPVKESKDKYCSDECCGSDVKAEDCKCPPTCKHCNCNAVSEGKKKYKSAAQRKAIHANKIKEGLADPYKNRLHQKLAEKSVSKAQQQAAGIALAAKRKGEKPKGKGAAAQMAKMSTKDLKDFAKTKHKGLPKKKTNETVDATARRLLGEGTEYQLYLMLSEAPMGNVVGKIKAGLAKMPKQAAAKATSLIKKVPKSAWPVAAGVILSMAGADPAAAGDLSTLADGLEKLEQLARELGPTAGERAQAAADAAQAAGRGAADVAQAGGDAAQASAGYGGTGYSKQELSAAIKKLGGGDMHTVASMMDNGVDLDKVKAFLDKKGVTDNLQISQSLQKIEGNNIAPMIQWVQRMY